MDASQAPEVAPPEQQSRYYGETVKYEQQHLVPPAYNHQTVEKKPRQICGLRASTFWLLLALLAVIVAAAVGGGVGGSMAVANAKKARYARRNPPRG